MAQTGPANMRAKVLLFSFMTATAFAGTRNPTVPDQKHVSYGEKFGSVAMLFSVREDDESEQRASCVIISPRHVLTAAHVVAGTDRWWIRHGGKDIPLTGISIKDGFSEDSVGDDDIAVGRLSTEVRLAYYPALYERDDECGKVASIAGYGMTGTFSSGSVGWDNLRRAGSNVIESTSSRGLLICDAGGARLTELEYCISPGDSGGGLFIGNRLAGVNSFVMSGKGKPRSTWGNESAHARVSVHREWIEEQVKCDE